MFLFKNQIQGSEFSFVSCQEYSPHCDKCLNSLNFHYLPGHISLVIPHIFFPSINYYQRYFYTIQIFIQLLGIVTSDCHKLRFWISSFHHARSLGLLVEAYNLVSDTPYNSKFNLFQMYVVIPVGINQILFHTVLNYNHSLIT